MAVEIQVKPVQDSKTDWYWTAVEMSNDEPKYSSEIYQGKGGKSNAMRSATDHRDELKVTPTVVVG